MSEQCPNCTSRKIFTETVTEKFPYDRIKSAFSASFPVMECEDCGFAWRDHRAETAISAAMAVYEGIEPQFFSRADEAALSAEADYWDGVIK